MFTAKRCQVCGKKASGFNYNGLTCASCKVFFYRNEHRKETFTCQTGGKCSMKVQINARCCMKCRLEKCLEIGMNKEGLDNNNKSSGTKTSEAMENPENFSQKENCRVDQILEQNIKKNLEYFQNENLRYDEKCSKLKRTTRPKMKKIEVEQINLVLEKVRSIFVEESSIKMVKQAQTYSDFSLPYQLYMGRIARFCQQITAYNQLNSEDQYRLFKSCCFSFLTIRTAYFYDTKMDGFVITEDDEGSSGVFRKFDFGRDNTLANVFMFNKNCTISLQAEMEKDITIRDLLAIQQLFKPYASTSNRELIRYHYMYYSRLLQHYLEHKYGHWQKANTKCSRLNNLVNHFPLMRENKAALLTLYNNQIPHVFAEIFNLV